MKVSAIFSDMPNDWSTEALEKAFGTTEMVSLNSYTDVRSDAWYYSNMAKALQMKVLAGADNKLT
jgi:hypothetical protein